MTQDWWNSTELQPMEIIHQIDKKVKRANYESDTFINWKFYSREVDNDASMSINNETGKIEELRFRADLREGKLVFLRAVIEMSNSYKFLQDPIKFLTELNNGQIKK